MIDIISVYNFYKKAESKCKNKPYKEPKNFELVWNRLSDDNKQIIQTLSDYFNTKWYNINPELYFLSGFKKWKSFNWSMSLRKEVMQKYISSDKSRKRNDDINNNIKESIEYIKENYDSIFYYCEVVYGNLSAPVIDYLRSKISGALLYWLISNKYLILTEQDNSYIMHLMNNEKYKEMVKSINIKDLL